MKILCWVFGHRWSAWSKINQNIVGSPYVVRSCSRCTNYDYATRIK